ncbi:MAG TPA: tetratricopeptide repeat protein [Bryobacteraceae bacterium]
MVALAAGQVANPAAEANRAQQLVAGGKPAEAVPIYRRLAGAYPNNAELWLDLSIAEFQAKSYSDAAEHARAALKINPDLAPAQLFLGASYFRLDRPDDALEPLQKAAQAMPNDRNAELLLAQTCDALAERAEHELATKWPGSNYALLLKGDSLRKQRRFGSAVAVYREALATGPAIPGLHAGLARVYRETGHTAWADLEDSREKATAQIPGESGPASAYRSNQSYRQRAAQSYERLAHLAPSLEAHIQHAKSLSADGRNREAVAEWRDALALAPDNETIHAALAQSLYESRDYEAVLPVLQDVNSVKANFLKGASLLQLDQPDRAIPYLEKVLQSDPNFHAARAALGQALLRKGNPEQAIEFLKTAATSEEDVNARFQLYRAYQLTGKEALAKDAFAAYESARRQAGEQRRSDDGANLPPP